MAGTSRGIGNNDFLIFHILYILAYDSTFFFLSSDLQDCLLSSLELSKALVHVWINLHWYNPGISANPFDMRFLICTLL